MEKLFSKNDILEIELNAREKRDMYWDAIVITGDSTEKTIRTLSKENELIFVEGNEHTGFEHFNDRHSFFSFKNYWISDNEEGRFKLDKPSKFHPKMMPIIDYVKIADTIFNPENKNTTNNNRPDVFDKYTGIYTYEDELPQKYHLLTYKDTKLVHTMYPDKKKYKRKTKAKYGKGVVTSNLKFPEGINDLVVPYENKDGIIVYSILLRKFYAEKTERLFIQKHDINGNPETHFLLGHRNFEDYESFDRQTMMHFQYTDLFELEDIINQIDENIFVSN